VDTGNRFIALRNQVLNRAVLGPGMAERLKWDTGTHFNWVLDYFDVIATGNESTALRVVDDAGNDQAISFATLAHRSNQVANYLSAQGLRAGDRVLVMLGNVVPLWETMLALMRMGAVIIPTTTLLQRDELQDRVTRGGVRVIIADHRFSDRFEDSAPAAVRICVGGKANGWRSYEESVNAAALFIPAGPTEADALMVLYFTSGTSAKPKLVAHTHSSYPVGHLSTAYWIGLRQGDVHLNLSSPGWAKHAWSCFFAPWITEATVLAYQYERFSAVALLDQLVRCRVTTLCAPPTVWRMLVQQDLKRWPVSLREIVGAGEPLNPEIIGQVQDAWGLTIRDGFGQTETTAQIGNPPGTAVKAGSMGRPLPGYEIALLDAEGCIGDEGEICLPLRPRPVGLMREYLNDPEKTNEVMRDGFYHTGDIARRDGDGYLTYIGRADDVFKSSDYRISPFELESVLIEHPCVAEAAVVPSPDSMRLSVPKAYIALTSSSYADAATAQSILDFVKSRVSPFKRIRRLEFSDLPKTISGKIRRAELRQAETERRDFGVRRDQEYWEEDFAKPS
jgi:acetyl-CoA synthetase